MFVIESSVHQLNRYIALSIITRVYMSLIKYWKERCTMYVSKMFHFDPLQPVNVNDSTWLCGIPHHLNLVQLEVRMQVESKKPLLLSNVVYEVMSSQSTTPLCSPPFHPFHNRFFST